MTGLRRIELLGGVATVVAGAAALAYAAYTISGASDACVRQEDFTSCPLTPSSGRSTLIQG